MHLTTGNFPPPSSRFFPRPKSHDNYFPPICLHRQRDSSILCFIPAAPLAPPLVHLHQQPLFSVGTLSPPLQLHQHRQHPQQHHRIWLPRAALSPPSSSSSPPRSRCRRSRRRSARKKVRARHDTRRLLPARLLPYLPTSFLHVSSARVLLRFSRASRRVARVRRALTRPDGPAFSFLCFLRRENKNNASRGQQDEQIPELPRFCLGISSSRLLRRKGEDQKK